MTVTDTLRPLRSACAAIVALGPFARTAAYGSVSPGGGFSPPGGGVVPPSPPPQLTQLSCDSSPRPSPSASGSISAWYATTAPSVAVPAAVAPSPSAGAHASSVSPKPSSTESSDPPGATSTPSASPAFTGSEAGISWVAPVSCTGAVAAPAVPLVPFTATRRSRASPWPRTIQRTTTPRSGTRSVSFALRSCTSVQPAGQGVDVPGSTPSGCWPSGKAASAAAGTASTHASVARAVGSDFMARPYGGGARRKSGTSLGHPSSGAKRLDQARRRRARRSGRPDRHERQRDAVAELDPHGARHERRERGHQRDAVEGGELERCRSRL